MKTEVLTSVVVVAGLATQAQAQMQTQMQATPSSAFPSVAFAGGMQTGEVAITEFMKDPSTVSDTRGEWIEVRNNLPHRVNLEGWILTDDAGN